MLRIFPARRRPRMKEPASGKQSQLDDEIAFRMQICSFAKIPEKKGVFTFSSGMDFLHGE